MTSHSETESLRLAAAVRDEVFEHARTGADSDPPREVCGVLVGSRSESFVTESHVVENVAADPRTRYELDPAETLDVVTGAESRGLEVVGFYHSHPDSPARPSDVDRAEATWVGYVYLVVSPAEGAMRAWRYLGDEGGGDDGFERLRVVVDDPGPDRSRGGP